LTTLPADRCRQRSSRIASRRSARLGSWTWTSLTSKRARKGVLAALKIYRTLGFEKFRI